MGSAVAVVHIDDDRGDLQLLYEAILETHMPIQLHSFHDGVAALAHLLDVGSQGHAQRPRLVLLDLNMSTMHGHEVLRIIKQNPLLADIPVVILTTSSHPSDHSTSIRLGADGYRVKPSTFTDLMILIRDLISIHCAPISGD